MTEQELLNAAQSIFGNIVVDVLDFKEHEGHAAGVDLITNPDDRIADQDGVTLQFENGHKVRFSTSEWATIQRVK